jgi:hypothetical protein
MKLSRKDFRIFMEIVGIVLPTITMFLNYKNKYSLCIASSIMLIVSLLLFLFDICTYHKTLNKKTKVLDMIIRNSNIL